MATTKDQENKARNNGLGAEKTPAMNIGANGKISIDGKVMREKPGFFKRMWHSMKSGSISKASLANPAVSQFLYETKNHIFGMGLTEDETNKVAQELRTIIDRDQLDMSRYNEQQRDELLRNSKTFRSTMEGKMYLESKFGAHSQREEKARELADKIISEMPQLDIKKPGKMECERFDMGLVFGNHTSWERMVIDPKDFALQREAANLAFSMGMSKQDSLRVGEEVFAQADALTTKDRNYNLNDLLAQSPTFSTYEQGVQYLQRMRLDMAVEQIHQENISAQQVEANSIRTDAANKLRSEYGLNPIANPVGQGTEAGQQLPGLGSMMGNVMNNGMSGVSQESHNGIKEFFGSILGRVVLAVAGFFMSKLLGGTNISGLLVGGLGVAVSPLLGNLFGSFSSRSDMTQQGMNILNDYDMKERVAENRERQQSIVNGRQIDDRTTEKQVAKEKTNAELMNIVREKGIDGIQVYFGADEKRLNEFLTRNNLNEVARNEAKVRMEGGNWLKATRDALASNTNNVSANINEGLKKHL